MYQWEYVLWPQSHPFSRLTILEIFSLLLLLLWESHPDIMWTGKYTFKITQGNEAFWNSLKQQSNPFPSQDLEPQWSQRPKDHLLIFLDLLFRLWVALWTSYSKQKTVGFPAVDQSTATETWLPWPMGVSERRASLLANRPAQKQKCHLFHTPRLW